MKNITLKIILSLVCCSLIIALILSGSAVKQGRDVMLDEVKKELLYTSQKYANQFSTELETQENAVDILSAMASEAFTTKEYIRDRARFLDLEKRLDAMIRGTMSAIADAQSLYFTFNPETSGANDEIWYMRNEKGEVYYMAADNTVSNWLVDDGGVESAYYFEAIRSGKRWSGVEYDQYLDTCSVTYSRSCLDKNGALIGVMGADIMIDHIFGTVRKIQLKEGGAAFLTDSGFHYLAGSKPESTFEKMKQEGILKPPSQDMGYSVVDGEGYLTACAETSNGWILILSQSEKNLLQPIQNMKRILFFMAVLILIGVLAYSYYFFKRSIAPIVKEFEQKDIIMLHQSRQAKLGEMVGNIAHQWKQPLNVMNITLSNLWDDFEHGKLSEMQLKAHIDNMRSYIRNMSGTVDDFAGFLKPSRKKEEFSLDETVDTALGLMQESIKINRITVVKDGDGNLKAYGYRNEFCQGVFNILNNARDAIIESNPQRREIRIAVYSSQDQNQKPVSVIDIMNDGSKIPDSVLPLLFQPYFTTKEEKGGTGIGLYLTKEIVEARMNGTVRIFNIDGGVCCRLMVPDEAPKEAADQLSMRTSKEDTE